MKNDWSSFHDVVFEAVGKSLSAEELKEIFNSLSFHVRCIAEEWGLGDTVFKDHAYEELVKRNKDV